MQNKLKFFEAQSISKLKSFAKFYWDDLSFFILCFIPENQKVIEIGCGNGNLLSKINSGEKVGIDFVSANIKSASKNYPKIKFYNMSAENLTLNEKFDYIILSNLIGYLDDIQIVIKELKKISHSKTKIIITYYNFLWQPLLKLAELLGLRRKQPEQNWLTKDDIKNLFYLEGFDVFKSGQRTLIPIYIPIISNIFNKYISKLPIISSFCLTNYFIAKPIAISPSINEYTVSVIIPARNESANIEQAILRMPQMGKGVEIIFVEGNSTDDTWEKIKSLKDKYNNSHKIVICQQDGKGKGDAVRKGFDMANGEILMILDADLTVPPEDLIKFYNAIAEDKGEFINGSRLVYNMEKSAMRFLNLIGNKFFSLVFTWLLDQRFKDTLCGTKVIMKSDYIKLKAGRKFFGEFDPFGDFDLIFGASKLNLKIVEIPIRYRERVYGSTNISRFKHGLLLLKMCLFASKKIKFT